MFLLQAGGVDKGGVSLFQKEIPLPYTHPEKSALWACGSKSCAACGIGCGVHGFAMNLLRFVTGSNRAHSVARV